MTSNRLHHIVALLLVGYSSLAGSTQATSQTRPSTGQLNIVNGSQTAEWPAIGALAVSSPIGYGAYCSGTLIGRDLVLTAAHCVDWPPLEYFVTGLSVQSPTSIYAITGVFVHPDYVSGEVEFDLAMLHLEGPTEEDPLAISTLPPYWDQEVIVAGYGLTGTRVNDTGVKHYGTMTIYDFGIHHVQLTGTVQACQGDSGGPMFVESTPRPVVRGVANFIVSSCEPGDYSFYHRLDLPDVLDWLATFPGVCYEGSPCDHLFVSNFE